jgi:hypothetical protein
MKYLHILVRPLAAAAALAMGLASGISSASAADAAGIYIGPNGFGIYTDSNTRRYYEQRHEQHDARWDTYGDWYADPNHYHAFDRARWRANDCFPVSRYAYDRRGRDVRMVATMCYRRDGSKYTVPGSEHMVR